MLYACGGLILLLWQYARRDTFAVRALVIAVFALGCVASAWPPRALAQDVPKWAAGYPEIAVVYAPQRGRLGPADSAGARDKIQVNIPIALTGRSRELLEYELVAIHITAESGDTWNSAWNWYTHASQRLDTDWIELSIDPRFFQRLSRAPVKLHAVFGVVVYELQTSARLRPVGEWTQVPGLGAVAVAGSRPGSPFLWWRTPLRYPSQKIVYTVRDPESEVVHHAQWSGAFPPLSEMHLSPVVSFATPFDWRPSFGRGEVALPNDIEGEIAVERPVGLVRRDLDIPSIRLGDYVVSDSR